MQLAGYTVIPDLHEAGITVVASALSRGSVLK